MSKLGNGIKGRDTQKSKTCNSCLSIVLFFPAASTYMTKVTSLRDLRVLKGVSLFLVFVLNSDIGTKLPFLRDIYKIKICRVRLIFMPSCSFELIDYFL